MRTFLFLVVMAGAIGIATAAPVCTPGSGVWNEGDLGQGDSGNKLATANITTGEGALTDICGNLSDSASGVDLYEIDIAGSTFTAATSGAGKNGITNPALYLFDAAGDGLYANDDTPSSTQAQLVLTGLDPGLYFLAIVPVGQEPENKNGNLIFGDITGTTTIDQPVVKNTVLDRWNNGGDDSGEYSISLDDASFAVQTPEPASLALLGAGLGALGLLRRRKLSS